MDGDRYPVDFHRAVRLAHKFRDKEYRDTYVEAHSRRFLAHQMREFRGDASQTEFGERIDKSQTIVSRLEDANYSGWSLRTLFEVAQSLNVAAIVRFVDFPTFLRRTDDQSDAAVKPAAYDSSAVEECAYEMARSSPGLAGSGASMTFVLEQANVPVTEGYSARGPFNPLAPSPLNTPAPMGVYLLGAGASLVSEVTRAPNIHLWGAPTVGWEDAEKANLRRRVFEQEQQIVALKLENDRLQRDRQRPSDPMSAFTTTRTTQGEVNWLGALGTGVVQ
jgi:hypothetical protein